MTKLQNRFVVFGAIAAAALAVPGVLGPLTFEEAYAQEARANNKATANLVNVQAAVAVNDVVEDSLNNNDVTVCVAANNCS